jgi:hypothetical protein
VRRLCVPATALPCLAARTPCLACSQEAVAATQRTAIATCDGLGACTRPFAPQLECGVPQGHLWCVRPAIHARGDDPRREKPCEGSHGCGRRCPRWGESAAGRGH